ncbi:putative fad binding domain protein [Phaeomoniella chlamydospora]|uniref:Putative fad binding domain protein n=1 Tax=Phaeomoniella chlamydospora TaxID=158046 RepID=A0A0G2F4P2_PHACM|nr:putative fad binding domain protein [Phaeomoniella chlamydospora]
MTKSNIPLTKTSHPDNPVPEPPLGIRSIHVTTSNLGQSPQVSEISNSYSDISNSGSEPSTPGTDVQFDDVVDDLVPQKSTTSGTRKRRASTVLLSQNSDDVRKILGDGSGTELIKKVCCGGGCCMMQPFKDQTTPFIQEPVNKPDNPAYRSLGLKLGPLGLESELSNIVDLPEKTIGFSPLNASSDVPLGSDTSKHPPKFVTPHPPYEVYSAPLFHARELTRPGAEKRTYHFDIDITDYPVEGGDVDFVVGGAIGVCAPNSQEVVDEIFDLLAVPRFVRDKKVELHTTGGRWPTIWGEEQPRRLVTTRRELLTWCADIQSYPPTKQLLRLMAEYNDSVHEKKILMYLSSAQGQASFCDLRTGPFLTLAQLLSAFPSSRPPLDHLLSCLNTLMPRFYSLSQDPQISCQRDETHRRKLVEIAVTVHDASDWKLGKRTGVGSGFLERLAQQVMEAEKAGIDPKSLDLRVPMFRGLMANPLAREFVSDGPMLLIGAGVGVAPFRGFVQRRLKSANCANKVWVLQGVRDSLLDELYSGEWGVEEEQVKKVVQSRRGEGRYVQEEVRHQADLVWFIINALDGRVFVCGSSKGMGEGVEAALVDVAKAKGNLNDEEAKQFWDEKKKAGQYIAETW